MPILIALADAGSGALLQHCFTGWGEEAQRTGEAKVVCEELQRPGGPRLAVVDCALPGEGGLAVCRQVRAADAVDRPYLILVSLTRAGHPGAALHSGADDFVAYPVALDELLARVEVGKRTLAWQQRLVQQVQEKKQAPTLVAMCAYCKGVRAGDRWKPVEEVLAALGQECSHTICPACYDSRVRPELAGLAGEAG